MQRTKNESCITLPTANLETVSCNWDKRETGDDKFVFFSGSISIVLFVFVVVLPTGADDRLTGVIVGMSELLLLRIKSM